MSASKKKAGPILFSEISFRDKEDSLEMVPEEERYTNGLHVSVHLNLGEHF